MMGGADYEDVVEIERMAFWKKFLLILFALPIVLFVLVIIFVLAAYKGLGRFCK